MKPDSAFAEDMKQPAAPAADARDARLEPVHLHRRLALEAAHEARMAAASRPPGARRFSRSRLIRAALHLSGLYRRGLANAAGVALRHNLIALAALPPRFDGLAILHLSDLHVDLNGPALERAIPLVRELDYDLCVLTGDYRGRTWGPWEAAMAGIERLRRHLHAPLYAVLGNHDTIRMVPAFEALGIRVLLNEASVLARGEERLYLAGVDDAHKYRLDDVAAAAAPIPAGACSILLSHTPQLYRQAQAAGFDLMLAGHTHGGQICLPGAVPLTLGTPLPRQFGAGPWR
jgi:predicted phosphodiesterase